MMFSGISETGAFLTRNKFRKEHSMSFTTSKSLLIRIHKGNEIAWSEFYSVYRPLIFLCGRDYHLSNSEIDDLLSRVMVKFFNAQKQFTYKPELGRFRNYFRNLIRNCIFDILKERKLSGLKETLESETRDFPDQTTWDDIWEDEWRAHICRQALDDVRSRLPTRAVQAFEACRLHGEKPAVIAKFLNVSLATVYNDCALVLRELQETVKKFSAEY